MTVTLSTFPVVKAALVDLTVAAVSGTQVAYGLPAPGMVKREVVLFGGTANWDEEWAALGAQITDDTYTIEAQVAAVSTSATSFQESTERAFALGGLVAGALRGVGSIVGVNLIMPLTIGRAAPFVQEYFTDDNGSGRATLLTFGVRVQARF